MTAVNDIGVSEEAPRQKVTAILRPGRPRDLEVDVKDGKAVITWSAPSSDGGTPLTGYRLMRGPREGSLSVIGDLGLVTTYTDDTVKDGRTYWYSVIAVNAMGDGEHAPAEKVQTPSAGTPTWLLATMVILVILAIIVIAMLLRGPRETVTPQVDDEPEETASADEDALEEEVGTSSEMEEDEEGASDATR